MSFRLWRSTSGLEQSGADCDFIQQTLLSFEGTGNAVSLLPALNSFEPTEQVVHHSPTSYDNRLARMKRTSSPMYGGTVAVVVQFFVTN